MISPSTKDELRGLLEKDRGLPVTDAELAQAVDQLYAFADLILEIWTDPCKSP